MACSQNPVHVIGKDTIWIPNVITSNGDGFNDSFYIWGLGKFTSNTIVFYDRDMTQLAQYSPYYNIWMGESENNATNSAPRNGLYHYKITVNSTIIEGSFLILSRIDDYFDIKLKDRDCSKNIYLAFAIDPLVDSN